MCICLWLHCVFWVPLEVLDYVIFTRIVECNTITLHLDGKWIVLVSNDTTYGIIVLKHEWDGIHLIYCFSQKLEISLILGKMLNKGNVGLYLYLIVYTKHGDVFDIRKILIYKGLYFTYLPILSEQSHFTNLCVLGRIRCKTIHPHYGVVISKELLPFMRRLK